jgi:hypothetical protein
MFVGTTTIVVVTTDDDQWQQDDDDQHDDHAQDHRHRGRRQRHYQSHRSAGAAQQHVDVALPNRYNKERVVRSGLQHQPGCPDDSSPVVIPDGEVLVSGNRPSKG